VAGLGIIGWSFSFYYKELLNVDMKKCFSVWIYLWGGTQYRSLLRHYATLQLVADSIPDVIRFFSWSNPSSHTVALGLTQPLTEMSARNLPGDKRQPLHKADNLTTICELLQNVEALTSHKLMGLHSSLQGGFIFVEIKIKRWHTHPLFSPSSYLDSSLP
jgi:hypothetical protein